MMSPEQVREEVARAAADLELRHLLVVIPDGTRTAPVDLFFKLLCEALHHKVERLTFLVALGTHRLMTEPELEALVGMSAEERRRLYPRTEVVNHRWDLPETFAEVGRLTRADTEELSDGRLSLELPIKVNKLLLEVDLAILLGPVFPHEVAGFSGGSKYLFPGVGGAEVINFTHWLGALATSHATIGLTETRVRQAIEKAAAQVPVKKLYFCLVTSHAGLHGFFWGYDRQPWYRAAELSSQVHISWKEKPFIRILSLIPDRYQDLWTGAKGMYKVEPVLADGGEVVLYAPHIDTFSYTHGKTLEKIGYHIRDYFLADWERFKDYPWGILAHSTHLRGGGTCIDGVEKPRIQVTLSSGISEERCRAMNLGYLDPATVHPQDWAGREDEGILLVPNAGETLFRIRDRRSHDQPSVAEH